MAAKFFTPSKLMAAIRAGRLDEVINAIATGGNIEEADMHGFAGLPLRTACFEGNLAIVRELLNRGADINAIAGDGPGAPLRLAQRGKHQEIIALLLAHSAGAMPTNKPAPSPTANTEAPPLQPAEVPSDEPVKADESPAVLPGNNIEFTRYEPDETVDIEEIDLTAGYGVDTNLLTLDLLRMSEAEDAKVVHSGAPNEKTSAKKEKTGFWKSRRGND